jgi:hypothetical protein
LKPALFRDLNVADDNNLEQTPQTPWEASMIVKNWPALIALGTSMLVTAGCNSTASLKDVETSCAAASVRYADAWNCARNQYLSYDEYRARYLATGDAVAAQVNAGQLSDAAARTSMAGGFSGGGHGRR